MQQNWGALALAFLLSAPVGRAQGARTVTLLNDFEKDSEGWSFIGGEEFPGAKGSLALDPSTAHGGAKSLKLSADFSGGGAYVGSWRDLSSLKGLECKELRLWVKAVNATSVGVRLVDHSDQCHQSHVTLPSGSDGAWQELVLKIRDLVGGEHWGGAGDGQWHGPLKGFGINLGKEGAREKTLWIDDVSAVAGEVIEGHPTILSAALSPAACRPGFGTRATFRWDAEALGRDCSVFVHILDARGAMAFQADHGPSAPTSIWKGHVEYGRTIVVPLDAAEGEYRIVAGLYDSRGRVTLKTGPGVRDVGGQAYEIGTLRIDTKAEIPKLPAPTLNLAGYGLTFNEEFNDLSVSREGPGTRWIAHTPYWGDFGDAGFADPQEGFPFTVEKGILRIEARKTNGRWQSGLLASVDPHGNGFSQQYGYFEMRAKFPKGPGMWPAFWLAGVRGIRDKSVTSPEIDVIEQYGVMPNLMCMTLHLWGPGDKHGAEADAVIVPGMTDDFHTYGVLVDENFIVWYYDSVELWRTKTPPEAKTPLYIMLNLAMGSGWPIDKAVSPSYMYVDYVKAYAKGAKSK